MTNKSTLLSGGIFTVLFVIVATAMGAFDYSVQCWIALACLVLSFALIISPQGKKIFTKYTTPLFIAVIGYVLWNGISMSYAAVPKSALFEFTKLIGAAFVFLAILAFAKPNTKGFRVVSGSLALATAIFGILSIDAASNGPIASIFKSFMSNFTQSMQYFGVFENGIRITGIFGNANTFSGFVVLGLLLALSLALNSETKNQKIFALSLLAINSMTYLLLFSMGSLGIFVIAIIAMLLLSSREMKIPTLVMMIEAAIVTIIFTMLALTAIGSSPVLPLACIVLNAVCLCVADIVISSTVISKLSSHTKAGITAGIVLLALIVVYAIAALNVTGSLSLASQETVMRAIYPPVGEYDLVSDIADGSQINVRITSQNENDLKVHTSSVLYEGNLAEAKFIVPEDSKIVKIYMTGASDTNTINSLSYTTVENATKAEKIKLDYTLLPSIAANRIQDLKANENTIQRMVFFEDGLKLFKKSPIIGQGLSGFETKVNSVQEFYYETRYVHNHYIQALCDLGIIGFAFFMGILVLCVYEALKLFKQAKATEYKSAGSTVLPVMAACLIMMFGQAITDLTWSAGPFLVGAFSVIALLIIAGSKDFNHENAETTAFEELPVSKDTASGKTVLTGSMAAKIVMVIAALIMIVLLSINLYATNKASSGKCTLEDIAQLAKIDRFGADDYKVSFIVTANSYGLTDYYEQADKYAAELTNNPDAVLNYLLPYYFNTNQEDKLFEAIKITMQNGRSSTEAWNTMFEIIRTATNPDREDPMPLIMHLFATDNQITKNMLDCYRELQQRNQEYLDDAILDAANIAFVGKLLGVENLTKEQLPEAIEVFSKTIFDSKFAVDVNVDGRPDNVAITSGNAVFNDGAVETTENTILVLDAYCVNGGEYTLKLAGISKTDGTPIQSGITASIGDKPLTVQYEGGNAVIKVQLTGAKAGDENAGIEATDSSLDKLTVSFPEKTRIAQITLKK